MNTNIINDTKRVDWDYFDRFDPVIRNYMPPRGEGHTMASQIVTATNKLIYKWYNDGDVYDNTHHLTGWCNDLSSYANWLSDWAEGADDILSRITDAWNYGDYERILKDLADLCLDWDYLEMYCDKATVGTIYTCDGDYKFLEDWEEDDYD